MHDLARMTIAAAQTRCRSFAIGVGLVAVAGSLGGCTEHRAPEAAPSAAVQPSHQGGMQAHIDPQTGELTDQRPPGAAELPGDVLVPPASSSQRPSPVPGGGVMIELDGDDDR